MATIIYPFGELPVTTIVQTTTNVYNHTVTQDEILNLKGSGLAADATLNLTAVAGLRAGSKLSIWWLSTGGARDVTVKPGFGTTGDKYEGTTSKYSSVTVIYDGTRFIPLSYLTSIAL